MESTDSFCCFQREVSHALVAVTRATSRVCAEDLDFHYSCSEKISTSLKQQNARVLSLTNRLLFLEHPKAEYKRLKLTNAESIDLDWRCIIEKTDILLEKVDRFVDEFEGAFNTTDRKQDLKNLDQKSKAYKKVAPFHAPPLVKPQLSFEFPPANHETQPFKPLLSSKPYSSIPLLQCLAPGKDAFGRYQYPHPYETEIKQHEYPLSMYTWREPISYQSFKTTTATFVNNMEGVFSMLDSLKAASEIAVDVEHHDAHSYLGLVCLIQISTRESDWVIDTLKPWRRKLEVLNEVFANPSIIKIFHGAQMDVLWLQRDLGLYVVGLFDTCHAARVLSYSSASLAFLLKKFVNFDAQKQYQTADWRLRPLPQSMFNYARSDTHFLLYIFDHIRNELIEASRFDDFREDKILKVMERSKETALQKYEYPFYDYICGLGRSGYLGLLQRTSLNLDRRSLTIFRRVHEWRDKIARLEDENVNQVMTNHVIFNIAKTEPDSLPSLLTELHPISPSVRQRSSDLLTLIRQAIDSSETEPSMHQLLSKASISKEAALGHSQSSSETLQNKFTKEIELETLPTLRLDLSSFWGNLSGRNKAPTTPALVHIETSDSFNSTLSISTI